MTGGLYYEYLQVHFGAARVQKYKRLSCKVLYGKRRVSSFFDMLQAWADLTDGVNPRS